ncbi:uncharacterized protein LOC119326653 isoform X2 [Triticum dicoccoides]|nr:uncharacterized protein LOC119326653 isoform X2 [Triticum dicoccoides]
MQEDCHTTRSSPTQFSRTCCRACASASCYVAMPNNSEQHTCMHLRYSPTTCMHALSQIFTNSDMDHTKIFLERLGLKDCFTNGIICFETLNKPYLRLPRDNAVTPTIFDIDGHNARSGGKLPKTPVLCKPNTTAMKDALNKFNVDPSKAIFFDDSERNIKAGKDIGMRIVLVSLLNYLYFLFGLFYRVHRTNTPSLFRRLASPTVWTVQIMLSQASITSMCCCRSYCERRPTKPLL